MPVAALREKVVEEAAGLLRIEHNNAFANGVSQVGTLSQRMACPSHHRQHPATFGFMWTIATGCPYVSGTGKTAADVRSVSTSPICRCERSRPERCAMKSHTVFRVAIAVLSSAAVLGLLPGNRVHGAGQAPTVPKAPAIAPATSQRIFAPLPKGHWLEGELVLNNNSPDAMTATPTFFSKGNTVPGTALTLRPGEVRWMRVSELNASTGLPLSATDAIEIQYLGRLLEVGAQLTLQGSRGVVDVPFSMSGDYQSSVQEAVWPAFRQGQAFVAIGNASDQLVFVTLEQPGRPARQLKLGPHMTRTVLAPTNNADVATSTGADWMRLDVRGPIGSVRATGFIETQRGITGGIRFYDPATAQQSDLSATNLKVEDNLPIMVLKNTGNAPVTARARFLPLSEEEGSPVELPDVTLPPQGARSVDLTPLRQAATSRDDLARVSAQVIVTGPVGSVVGGVYLVGRTGLPSYDVPLREPGKIRQSTGSYPWRLDGDYTTLISITNVSASTAQFHARITSAEGVYWLPEWTLKPGRTATFDMQALRDRQIRDMNGNTLPQGILTGQFRWSIVRSSGETKLIGRAEIASRAVGRATSYSCPVCCPDSTNDGLIDPTGEPGLWGARIGGTGDIPVIERRVDCYGNWAGDYLTPIDWWIVPNPGVASAWTIDTGWGRAGGNSEGTTAAAARFTGEVYTVQPGNDECRLDPWYIEASSSLYGVGSGASDPAKLKECLAVCEKGRAAIESFCRSLPDPRWRALCWASRWSVVLCQGFCYAIWGE